MKTMTKPMPTAETDTDLAGATAKLRELEARRTELQQSITAASRRETLESEAQLLIVGSSRPRPDVRALVREREVVEEAVRLQRIVIAKAQSRVNERQRIANQAPHAKLLRDLKAKLLDAEQAAAALESFYSRVDNLVPRIMRFRGFGDYDPATGRFDNVQRWQRDGDEFYVFQDVAE